MVIMKDPPPKVRILSMDQSIAAIIDDMKPTTIEAFESDAWTEAVKKKTPKADVEYLAACLVSHGLKVDEVSENAVPEPGIVWYREVDCDIERWKETPEAGNVAT